MSDSINILILSCGTRNKIVQYFKNELAGNGKVFATDCSNLAPALYDADEYFIVPRMTDKEYLDTILKICKENKINGVLSLIDPELSLLAENSNKFLEIGTVPIVSDSDFVELSFDKYLFNEFLKENKFNAIPSYIHKSDFYTDLDNGDIEYPVFVKPVKGSASININKASSNEEIELLFSQSDNLMIQKYMNGKEYGVDVYIDMITGELSTIFIKQKLKMRAGETDKSVSIIDSRINNLIQKFVEETNYRGIIDIDIFEVDNELYISEVNPRFGGGYPHAYECGVNIPKMIINNLKDNTNSLSLMNYEKNIYLMKFSEVCIIKK